MDTKFLLNLMLRGTINVPSLLIEHYQEIGLNEQECMLLIEVHSFIIKGDDFPTFEDLSKRMTLEETPCADLLRHLIQHGFLSIVQKKDNQIYSEAYSLQLLWEKLLRFAAHEQDQVSLKGNDDALYTLFETEFGRPLSPIECETLAMWIDEDRQAPQLIKAALREAVISGKLNFRYIDRILFDWRKNGIQTLEQAKAQGSKIRRHQQPATPSRKKAEKSDNIPQMPSYNWLDKA